MRAAREKQAPSPGRHRITRFLLCLGAALLLLLAAGAGAALSSPGREPPVISGARDLEVFQGESVVYRAGVSARGGAGEELPLQIDSSRVNTAVPGQYPAVYTTQDAAGNRTDVTVTVTVLPLEVDREALEQTADRVLEEIFQDAQSDTDKVSAVYDYLAGTVRYRDQPVRGDPALAAYEGLCLHRGDCSVYCYTAALLLERAGIRSQVIHKSTASGTHYWNLVDLGSGWLHFDATPLPNNPRIVLWNDARLMAYSASNSDSHDYDHRLYPDIN